MSALPHILDRFVDAVGNDRPDQVIRYRTCTVASVAKAASTADGGDIVYVNTGDPGGPQAIIHVGPTPAVGALVGVLFVSGSPLVLGALTGAPNY